MTIRAYVLIETEVASAKLVGRSVREFTHPGARVLAADTVTGPYDVIALIEADDLDQLGNAITGGLQAIPGVKRTTTCLAIRVG
mgnify:CR=1 FL=1